MHNINLKPALVLTIILLCCAMSPLWAAPDKLSVRVYDAQSQKPVEFCNMVAKNIPTGALADEQGCATLTVGPRTLRDTLLVSCVGYEKQMVIMNPEMANLDTLRIYMVPRSLQLSEVTVKPSEKHKILKKGKRHKGGLAGCYMHFDRGECYAWEAGSKGKRIWLTGLEIQSYQPVDIENIDSIAASKGKITAHPIEKMRLRVNIYDATHTAPGTSRHERWGYEQILNTPIIINYSNSQVVDNSFSYTFPEPIFLPDKALVEIEILDEIPENETLGFKTNILARNVLIRDINDQCWLKLPVATPFTLIFLEEKM